MFGLNWIDFVLGLGLLIGVVSGFTQGLLRQVIALAAMYIGAILATQYYTTIGRWLKDTLTTTPGSVLQSLAFFFVFFVATLIINTLAYDAYRSTKFQFFPIVDNIGGALIGLFNAWLLLSILLLPTTFATNADTWGTYDWIRTGIQNALATSYLAGLFRSLLPSVIAALKPFLPPGLSTIFNF